MSSHKIAPFFPIIIFLAFLFLSVGYAAINSITLDIVGFATAHPKETIVITDVAYVSDVNAIKENSEIVNIYDSMFNSHIELSPTDKNSSITYRITIQNNTLDTYAFKEVSYSEEWYDNLGITFDLDGITSGYKLLGKKSVSFNITFHYNGNTVTNNILNSYLDFSFKKIYTVTYENFTNVYFPTEIMEEEDLEVEFKEATRDVIVYKNDVEIREYTYKNPVLVVPNVNANIRIVKENYEDVDFVIDEESNVIVAEGISPNKPISVKDIINQVFDGKNITPKLITQLDVTYTYTSKTGAEQSINCILEVNGRQYTQVVTFAGKTNNQKVTVSFTNLRIAPKDSFIIRTETSNLSNGNISISENSVTVYFDE